jgi:hypothetical protein
MSTSVRKLRTDDKTFYVGFDSVVDLFITPAIESLDEFIEYADQNLAYRGITKKRWRSAAEEATVVYDLRRMTIHDCTRYLAELKSGRTLTDDQACELFEFSRFLEEAVAPHQYSYPEVSKATVEKWLDELDLRKLYPKNYDWQDILDNVKSVAYHNVWSKKHYDFCKDVQTGQATSAQNKLAGRYLSALCTIAQIAGPDRKTVPEIVDTVLKKGQSKK